MSEKVIGCAIEVHRHLGPGLLESAYEACLSHEFSLAGIRHVRQVALPVHYKGIDLDVGYRLDLIVEQQLVVDLKAVDNIHPIHEAQLLTYLRLSGHRRGLLLNFHAATLKDGIKRMVL